MDIFKSIALRNSGPTCRQCTHFQNDPAVIEAAWPGLTTMSSGFASVRHQDGFCDFNRLYLSAGDCCPEFEGRGAESRQKGTENKVAIRHIGK